MKVKKLKKKSQKPLRKPRFAATSVPAKSACVTPAGTKPACIELESRPSGHNTVWRQPAVQNQYNPDGLSLAAINMELSDAFGPQTNHQQLTQHLMAEMLKNCMAREAYQKRTASTQVFKTGSDGKKVLEKEDEAGNVIDVILIQRMSSVPTQTHLVQNGDSHLAALIKACPEVLLQSLQAQDALARWTYATRISHDSAIRKQAQHFLTISSPVRKGNPGKASPNLAKFLMAYDDLCRYCKCIFAAADATHSESAIRQHFADAEIMGQHGLILKELIDPRLNKPAPSDMAASYINTYSGLSKSRIVDLVSKARA